MRLKCKNKSCGKFFESMSYHTLFCPGCNPKSKGKKKPLDAAFEKLDKILKIKRPRKGP